MDSSAVCDIADIHHSSIRHCCELGYEPHYFLKEAQVPDLKIFRKWTLDRYKRIDAASSLRNYWRVLKMHILDKADRDFYPSERRDIRNVRCPFPELRKPYADVLSPRSISIYLSTSTASGLCPRRNL